MSKSAALLELLGGDSGYGSSQQEGNIIESTALIASAFASNNACSVEELPALVAKIRGALQGNSKQELSEEITAIGQNAESHPSLVPTKAPAVDPKKSVHDDYIICLEDGAKMKMLKRYLSNRYNLTPQQYREKWGLDKDYPMVAPSYSKSRAQVAKRIGLGQQGTGGRRKSK